MSKIGDAVNEFLNGGGSDLGYSNKDLPDLKDLLFVIDQQIPVWEYHGKTEKQYYS